MKNIKIVEFKARCINHQPIKTILEERNARYVGEDHQIDTYYTVPKGRLKLREGTIERNLIYYERLDQAGPKLSDVLLYTVDKTTSPALKLILNNALGVKIVVDKRRHIYFIDNIKIHLDQVEGLGSFIEVEAIDEQGSIDISVLREQCLGLLEAFEVSESDLISNSYSDMLLAH